MKRLQKINIYGSTGKIGTKSLDILKIFFPFIKINLLVANKNYKKLIKQANLFKPKYVCIIDQSKFELLKKNINDNKTIVIEPNELINFINKSKSSISLLSISGYNSLNYLLPIINNTQNLGIVNKECIVSAGHLFKKININKKVKIYPIDSEHYSLQKLLSSNTLDNIENVFLTASGGPFFKKKFNEIKNISLKEAIRHPKWKMGIKNSIDSATLSNKCLEIIEAHYLFNIPFYKLNTIIHPQALVHSIIEYKNYDSIMNFFYHDMFIPLFNFFSSVLKKNNFPVKDKYKFNSISSLNFYPPNTKQFPILKIFNEMDKSKPLNLIKFNCANEHAVNLFASKMIKFGNIHKIIEKSLSLDFDTEINDVSSILEFQKNFINVLKQKIY